MQNNSYFKAFMEAACAIGAQEEGVLGVFEKSALVASAARTMGDFEAEFPRTARSCGILFTDERDNKFGGHVARQFLQWRAERTSITGLVCAAAEKLGVSSIEPVFSATLMTTIAAEVEHKNAYHDNSHFREVTAVMAMLCHAHNNLQGVEKLDGKDIAKCLMAAAAHDLAHDGKGNSPGGVHEQYRLENKAIAAIEPFMTLAGMTDKDKEDVRVMIRVTDVTAPKGGVSPHKILRKIVAGEDVVVPPELSSLVGDKKLQQMAAMLSDADLTPSAATNYAYMRRQSDLLATENPAVQATAENMSGFLHYIVDKEFTSDAARAVLQPTLKSSFSKVAVRLMKSGGKYDPQAIPKKGK